MQIKQVEGSKNLPVHPCLVVPHHNTGRLHVKGKQIENGNTRICQKAGTEIIILNTCISKREIIKLETILDVRTHGKNTKPKEIFQIKHFFTISLKVKNNLLRLRGYDYTLSLLPEYIL